MIDLHCHLLTGIDDGVAPIPSAKDDWVNPARRGFLGRLMGRGRRS
jgi:tyrosine-protein phosphatase YwqE